MLMFGPDWNHNGKTDAFDHMMNMKVLDDMEKNHSGRSSGKGNNGCGWLLLIVIVFVIFYAIGAFCNYVDEYNGYDDYDIYEDEDEDF